MRIALATLAAALLLAAPAAAQTDTTPTIAADGNGTATLVPDLADFSAGVLRRAPTSAAARRAANVRIAAILKAVKARGVADADIQTTGLSIAREHVGRRGHRGIRYTATQDLRIRVRDVKTLGAMLDAVADAGADAVAAPDFGFADPSQGRLLATRAALADPPGPRSPTPASAPRTRPPRPGCGSPAYARSTSTRRPSPSPWG